MINQHYYRMNSNFINCLRWIFVIPCAILGAFVGQALAMFIGYIVPWFADWFIHILGSYFIGISFVFLGTFGYIGSMMFGSFFGDTEQLFFYILLGGTLAIYIKYKNENNENENLKIN